MKKLVKRIAKKVIPKPLHPAARKAVATKPRRAAVATAVVLGAAGLGYVTNQIAQPNPYTVTCPSDAPAGATCYGIPTTFDSYTISSTGTADDTVPLENYFNYLQWNGTGTPQGTPANPIDIEFTPGATYDVDGQMYLRAFQDWYFNGNGATFVENTGMNLPETETCATSAMAGCTGPGTSQVTDPLPNPSYPTCTGTGGSLTDAVANNHGTPAGTEPIVYNASTGMGGRYTTYYHDMWFFEGGCNIVLVNMNLTGPNSTGCAGGPGPTGSGLNCDGANFNTGNLILFANVKRAYVNGVTMNAADSDCVTSQGLQEATGLAVGQPSEEITVVGNTCKNAGRDDLTVIEGDNITYASNMLYAASQTDIDVEVDNTVGGSACQAGTENDIDVSENTFSGEPGGLILSAQTESQTQRLEFSGNNMIKGAQMRVYIFDEGTPPPSGCSFTAGSDIDIGANTATTPDTSTCVVGPPAVPCPDIRVAENTGVYVHNNVDVMNPGGGGDSTTFYSGGASKGVTGAAVDFNTLATGATVTGGGGVADCGNTNPAGTLIDTQCSGPPGTVPVSPALAILPLDFVAS